MNSSIGKIIKDVKVCIDEIALNDADFVGGEDNKEMDTIIKSKIADAVNFVYGNASADMIGVEGASMLDASEAVMTSEGCKMYVGDEFLRFVEGRMSGWLYPVTEITESDDAMFAAAKDRFVGADWQRPMILRYRDVVDGESKCVIELVKPRTEADTAMVWYYPKFDSEEIESADEDDDIAFNSNLYRAIIYYISGLVLVTYNEKDRAQEMLEMATSMMGASGQAQQNITA